MNQYTGDNPQATDGKLDHILAAEPPLVPTSGFLAAVMERVEEEAAAPAPIAFPWKRVLPAAVVAAGLALWSSLAALRFLLPTLVESLHTSTSSGTSSIQLSSSIAGLMLAAGAALLSWMIMSRILRRT
jgi:predicted permease